MLHLKPYPEYRVSGVPVIGDVPKHWDVQQLGRFGRLSKGNGGSKDDEVADGIPCIRYGDIYVRYQFSAEQSRSFIPLELASGYTTIEYGDVLFAGSGETIDEIGKSVVNLIEPPVCCGGDIIVFRPAIPVHPRFLGYAADCRPAACQKSRMGRGITVMHIYGDQLKYLWVTLPPIDEQVAIARFLDYVDRRIRRYILAKQKLIKLLEEQKQAIIHRAVTLGLDPDAPLKPSGIQGVGNLPSHWEIRRLKYASGGVTVGVVVNPSSYFDDSGDVPMLLGNNVLPGRFRLDRVQKISTSSNKRLSKSQLRRGDLVVVRVGAPGVAAVVPSELDGANCASVLIVRKGRNCLPRWLEMVFNSPVVRRQVDIVKYGAAQKQFNVSHAVEFRVPVPPLAEQTEILEGLDRDLNAIEPARAAAEEAIHFLREYRTRLIADVVTGKLNVREAAEHLPDEVEEFEELALAYETFEDGDEAELASDELAEGVVP